MRNDKRENAVQLLDLRSNSERTDGDKKKKNEIKIENVNSHP